MNTSTARALGAAACTVLLLGLLAACNSHSGDDCDAAPAAVMAKHSGGRGSHGSRTGTRPGLRWGKPTRPKTHAPHHGTHHHDTDWDDFGCEDDD